MNIHRPTQTPRDIFEYLGYSREEFNFMEKSKEEIQTIILEARVVFPAFKRLHPEAFLKPPFEDLPDDHPEVQQWLAEEVLPSIREFGFYSVADHYLHRGEITFVEYVRYSLQALAAFAAKAPQTIH